MLRKELELLNESFQHTSVKKLYAHNLTSTKHAGSTRVKSMTYIREAAMLTERCTQF